MNKIKLIAILVLAIMCIIIVLQNTEPVVTKILFITITMPRAVLLLTTAIFGFAIGMLVPFIRSRKKKDPEATMYE